MNLRQSNDFKPFLLTYNVFFHQNEHLWLNKLVCRSKDERDTVIRFPCHGFGILDAVQYIRRIASWQEEAIFFVTKPGSTYLEKSRGTGGALSTRPPMLDIV